MARKSKTTRRRSPRAFNVLSAVEALAQSEILLRGVTGTGVLGFVTGQQDLAQESTINYTYGSSGLVSNRVMTTVGANPISLSDFLSNPSLALNVMGANARENFIPMAIASVGTTIGFRLFKRMFAKPRREANKLIRMTVGKGVATI